MARFEVAPVDTALRAVKHQGSGRETEYRVVGNAGLVFVVQRSGKRSWRYYYSIGSGGQRRKRKVGLGSYPAIGLGKARANAAALDVRVAEEGDVVAVDREKKQTDERLALTLSDFLADYVALRQGLARIGEVERELRKDVIPALGHRRPSEITAADIDQVGTAIKARQVGGKSKGQAGGRKRRRKMTCATLRNANSSAYRMVMHVKAMYNYALFDRPALAEKYGIEKNPAATLGRRRRGSRTGGADGYAKPKPRTRTLLDDEIVSWAKALDESAMRADTKLALKLILVTAQRPGELRRAERSEFRLKLAEPVWVIPPKHSKNGKEHLVPLSPLAVSLIQEAIKLSRSERLLFPDPKNVELPLRNVVLPTAQANLFRNTLPDMEPATAHDLRRTAATGMRRRKIDRDTVGLILNHAPTGVTARHYDHYEGEAEKREALDDWAARLGVLCGWAASAGRPVRDREYAPAIPSKHAA